MGKLIVSTGLLIGCALLLTACQRTLTGNEEGKKGLSLSKDGKTGYVIMVAPGDVVSNTAAKELAEHLKAVTGAEFPIVSPGAGRTSLAIAVGPAAAKALMPDLNLSFPKLGNDGIVMRSQGGSLALTGAEGAKRGTLYAVYEFLEGQVGCRWWTSTSSYIPKRPSLAVPALDTVYAPEFRVRGVFYRDVLENGVFATKCRSNGHWDGIPANYGGHCKVLGFCHTFYQLLPPERYFKSHPEWYSEIKGKRTSKAAQLCLSNDDMRRELTRNALGWLRKDPGVDVISISQNDNIGKCECAKCRAGETIEGAPSGLLISFVNKVAEDIEKEFPNAYVQTIAYQYTRKPPLTVRPRGNVIVMLTSIECSFSQPLAAGPQNEAFRRDIEAWSSIAPQLFIWDYVTNFSNYLQPHPNLRVLAPNIRFFAAQKVVGLTEQGDAGSSCGDFVALRAWLLAHLMWNPSLDEKALVAEFMDGYYGPASTPLRQHLELVHDAVEASGTYLTCYMGGTPWLDIKGLNQATKLFEEAAAKVKDDPELSQRVRKARMSLDYTWIKQYGLRKREAALSGETLRVPSDMRGFCADFINAAHDFQLGKLSETVMFKDMEANQSSRFNTKASPPERCVGLPENQWLDVQDYDFQLFCQGEPGKDAWVTLVEDAKASDKRAAKMPGNHKNWAVQYPFPLSLQGSRCHVVIRCDVKPGASKSGAAFAAGIYDSGNPKDTAAVTVAVEHVADGEYRTYDLGVCDLNDGYIWVAPCENPEVTAVYVDRIFFVNDKVRPAESLR